LDLPSEKKFKILYWKTLYLKRLDQGHLHPKLMVPGLTCPGRESNPDLREPATFFCGPDREITFENAEELTEEGLPFLILFHNPDDTDSIKVSRLYW
jgi:hypothetical protein